MINSVSSITCLKSLMQADFQVLLKNRRSLYISVVFPLFLLFIWNNPTTLHSFGGALFTLAIIITISIMSLSIFGYTLAIARDREKGIFQRLRVTPAPTWTIMTSRLLVSEIANLVIAVVVLALGSGLYHLSITPLDYVLGLLVSLLAGAVFLSIGQALVGLIKSADTLNAVARFGYIGLVIIGLVGFSGAFGPTIKSIALWSPFGSVIQVYNGLPNIGLWDGRTSLALLICFIYIIMFGFIGIKWFKWEAR